MSTDAQTASPWIVRFWPPVVLLALMWVVQIAGSILPGDLTRYGVRSWDFSSAAGLITAPFLHSGWPHLLANSVAFLVLGLLVALGGVAQFWVTTLIIMAVGGLGVWVVNTPNTVTVGASILVFGYFGYLLVRTFVVRGWQRIRYFVIALIVILVYGSSLLGGLIPVAGVSWQGHLFGAIGGIIGGIVTRPKRAETVRTN